MRYRLIGQLAPARTNDTAQVDQDASNEQTYDKATNESIKNTITARSAELMS